MDEYVEREKLRDALYEADAITMRGVAICNQFPAADVVPVRHGKWIVDSIADNIYRCNKCGNDAPIDPTSAAEYKSNYCPNCGALMKDGDGDGV